MRQLPPRLLDPHNGHGRLAAREHGAKTTREVDDDLRTATKLVRLPSGDRPRVTGNWGDGSALRNALTTFDDLGILIDETQIETYAENAIYENNAGLYFRGTPPSATPGGATVIGTGGVVDLLDANDNSGRIRLTTGTSVSASGNICTITFVRPKQNADYGVFFHAADATASGAVGQTIYSDHTSRSTTVFSVAVSSILASSVDYHWDYLVIERDTL